MLPYLKVFFLFVFSTQHHNHTVIVKSSRNLSKTKNLAISRTQLTTTNVWAGSYNQMFWNNFNNSKDRSTSILIKVNCHRLMLLNMLWLMSHITHALECINKRHYTDIKLLLKIISCWSDVTLTVLLLPNFIVKTCQKEKLMGPLKGSILWKWIQCMCSPCKVNDISCTAQVKNHLRIVKYVPKCI